MKRLKPNTEVVVGISNETGKETRTYVDTRTGHTRNRWWTKARIPGVIRESRKPGGSGFRNNWEGSWSLDGGWYVEQQNAARDSGADNRRSELLRVGKESWLRRRLRESAEAVQAAAGDVLHGAAAKRQGKRSKRSF